MTPKRATAGVVLAVFGLVLATDPCRAAYTYYGTRSAFFAASQAAGIGPLSTETFDELTPLSTYAAPVTLDGVTYAAPGSPAGTPWEAVPGTIAFTPESPPNAFMLVSPTPAALWFGGGSVGAFGFAVIAPGSIGPSNRLLYQIEVFDTDGSRHDLLLNLTSPGASYVGFVASGESAIAEVGLITIPGSTPVSLDDVSRGAITPGSFGLVAPVTLPEPGSALMLGLGLAGVAFLSRARGLFSA